MYRGAFLYVLYRFVLIFNKFWFSSLLVEVRGTKRYEEPTAQGSKFVLPHWGLEWDLKPVMSSVGNIPGSIPGQLHWKMSKGKKFELGPTDHRANIELLCYAGLLILDWTGCIFILAGWGRGIDSVYTQIQTRDTQIMRRPLNHCAMLACLLWIEVSGNSYWLVGGGA